ncbi:unnamed protein product [uncultured bacterium]|nr:unnamed protein product [uncultured bacterium]
MTMTAAARWRERYDAHIGGPAWALLRSKVFARCGGVCEGCGERRAVEVHHLTYAHLGEEYLWELRAVCARCHGRLHGGGSHG